MLSDSLKGLFLPSSSCDPLIFSLFDDFFFTQLPKGIIQLTEQFSFIAPAHHGKKHLFSPFGKW